MDERGAYQRDRWRELDKVTGVAGIFSAWVIALAIRLIVRPARESRAIR